MLVVLLWAPLAAASSGPSRSEATGPEVSVPEWIVDSGWMEVFESLLRVLAGADDGDGGGTMDPSGTPGDGSGGTSGGESTTDTGGTTTTEDGGGLQP